MANTLRSPCSVVTNGRRMTPLRSHRAAGLRAPAGGISRARKPMLAPVRAMDPSVLTDVAGAAEEVGSASALGLAVAPFQSLCSSFALGAKNNISNLYTQFEFYCNTKPLTTTVTTGALLYGSGNYVSQLLTHSRSDGDAPFDLNLESLALFFAWGALDGVMGHEFYSNLEIFTAAYLPQLSGLSLVTTKVATEELIYSPIWYIIFFAYMELLAGRTWGDAGRRIQADLVPVMKLNAKMWVPLGFINFTVIPPHVRVPFVFCEAFVFSILLSLFDAEGPGHHGAPAKDKAPTGSVSGSKDDKELSASRV